MSDEKSSFPPQSSSIFYSLLFLLETLFGEHQKHPTVRVGDGEESFDEALESERDLKDPLLDFAFFLTSPSSPFFPALSIEKPDTFEGESKTPDGYDGGGGTAGSW
ncbi:hypothetical protein POM88_022989 [Heracleum sosnowskyi]|uniref:Uncharacterized protein n=1 Tax=Heracleum sosnowskyi TaxID=360622 RepID=A0AAD8IG74_9APIA|nr:hypothetical protein POM88_022989 [Heracleum sosnowskyi]